MLESKVKKVTSAEERKNLNCQDTFISHREVQLQVYTLHHSEYI